jgi:hypothetical protein
MNKKFLEKILTEVSLDHRVKDGMFNIEENDHMEALRDYLTKKGIDEEEVRRFSNKVLEGKYPERQAYNTKGILVTFPTPEYKADAIKRGTHFEEDPTKKASNIFSEPTAPSPAPDKKPAAEPEQKSKTEPKTNLPVSQAAPPSADATATEKPVQAKTTAAPQQTPAATSAAEPIKEPDELPLPPPKSPAEKEADKNAIKTMLKGDDYMLDEVVQYIMFNAPPYMLNKIKKLL